MLKKKILLCCSILLLLLFTVQAKESPDITVFRPGVSPRNKKDPMVRAKTRYEKEYGGKVTLIISDWINWQAKILQNMAAGEPIDVVFCGDVEFPKFYTQQYLQPLDDYVDLTIPWLNKTGMEQAFKFNGHYYAASQDTSNHYWIIIYNKTLMEEEGIPESEQPGALYAAGKWNWAALRNLAMKLTKDTTGTGTIDRWGFANWWTQGFVYMNGSSFTKQDSTGKTVLNFDDQRLMEALTFLETAKKEGWYQQDNNIAKDGLQNRTVAMFMEREYYPSQILKDCRDELGYVPLPVGPGNKEGYNFFETDGYGIGNGSDSPSYAGKFINICLDEWHKEDLASRKKSWPQEILDMTPMVAKKAFYPGRNSSAVASLLSNFLGEIIWTGNSPSSAIAGYTAKAEMLIEEANRPLEKPVRLDFKPIKETFEKKDSDKNFKIFNSEQYPSVKVALTKDAITGKQSMAIDLDPSQDSASNGYIDAVITDPEKLGVVGWRNYKVTFNLKIGEIVGDEPFIYLEAFKDDIQKYGWIKKNTPEAGTVYKVLGYMKDVYCNGRFGIKIGVHNLKNIVIDDFVIEETN